MIEWLIISVILVLIALTLYPLIVGTSPLPTPRPVSRRMLELANIKKGDKVYDLGCGDGRLVLAAAKQGAEATGYEISPAIFAWAWLRKTLQKSSAKIKFRDFLLTNLEDADTIFLFMYPTTNKLLLPRKFNRELKPGAKVISYSFEVPGLKLIHKEKLGKKYSQIYVYQI